MDFLTLLPRDIRFAFEFRDLSWFNDEVYSLLKSKGRGFCIYHMPDLLSPVEVTAPFVYIRFHGTEYLYGGRYPTEYLKEWARRIKGFMEDGLDVYSYFNNDAFGYAVINAMELKEMVR
jgi:uncharacterized protein YecE (DUF72 family)